jgi:hypothetical protein
LHRDLVDPHILTTVSHVLEALRPTGVRVLGLVVALGTLALITALLSSIPVGWSLAVPGIEVEADIPEEPWAFMDRAAVAATLLSVCVFSWLLAERAVLPGWKPAVEAVLAFNLGAIVLGSFVVAGLASLAEGVDLAATVGTTVAFGTLGIVFLSIPTFVVGLIPTTIWALVLRVVVNLLSRWRQVTV